MRRPAAPALIGLTGLLSVTLTSCTSAKDFRTQESWTSRADSVLHDPDGLGSGGGGAPGSMDVGVATKQRWVIYATCTNADFLRMTVKSGDAVVAQTKFTCDTNTQIPVTVNPAAHLTLEITKAGQAAGLPSWFAAINTTAWKPKSHPTATGS